MTRNPTKPDGEASSSSGNEERAVEREGHLLPETPAAWRRAGCEYDPDEERTRRPFLRGDMTFTAVF